MEAEVIIQGRILTHEDIEYISSLISANPSFSRRRISRDICKAWGWITPYGQLKDMACRTMLYKLERAGYITLPPSQNPNTNAQRMKKEIHLPHDTTPITGLLKNFIPIKIETICDALCVKLFRMYLKCYHYLGLSTIVGENIKYMIYDRNNMPLACLLFSAAAWKTAPRDIFIGWPPGIKNCNLQFIANNSRYLIFPWVKVPHLASHILGRVAKRISCDWQLKYHHPIHLLETFVRKDKYRGTCYRAANWICVGETKGRGKKGVRSKAALPIKSVWLYPLTKDYREVLCSCSEEKVEAR
jgi:hypothetical protein